jgi:hypothetical protein
MADETQQKRDEQTLEPEMSEGEETFFEGSDEELDPELLELAEERSRGSVLRPVLMIAVIMLGASILSDWRDNLAYFFSASEPVEVGSVTEFPVLAAEDPAWSPKLPHNAYVRLSGVPTRRSQSERYNYFKLVGGEVYIETRRDDFIENPLERELAGRKPGEVDRTYFDGTGRLQAFGKFPERYNGLRRFYNQRYNTYFCEQYDERELAEVARRRRETIRANWAAEYERASAEERAAQNLRPEPSEAELQEVFESEPLCVNAYLLQEGVSPRDHWWYVALAGLIGFFMLFNTVMLGRWFWRFLR